jgi:peroxiredoxin
MMTRVLKATGIAAFAAFLAFGAATASAKPELGKPAPAFTGVDADGKTWTLADLRGKIVVLEWTNDGCPFVKKHYTTGNMQSLQKAATADGVVWLSVISSAEGTQGYVKGPEANRLTKERDAAPSAVILDPNGDIGKAYDAQTTPHMYIVGKDGTLLYMGAIDDNPSSDPATVKGARNYVSLALAEIKEGKPVSNPVTRAYGCSVKYKSSTS